MKRNEDFRKALGQPDEYFRQSVIDTLDQLNRQAEKESRPQRRYTTRIIASFAAVVLLVAGIILNRQYIPGTSPDGHVDTINPTPTVATQVAESSYIVDTAYATMVFKDAVRDGDNIRFTLEIQPKQEKNLILSANHLLTSACKYTADFYGIQPKDPEQSMYSWVVDHGYQEALAVSLNSPWDGTEGPFYGSYQEEKCQLRDDGSAVMTLVGPAADNNVYELEWHIVPWNMEDKGNSFHPDLHNHGTIRLEVTDEKQCAVTVVTPSHLPDESRIKLFPAVVDTAYATLTFQEAVRDGDEIRFTVEIQPKHEQRLIVSSNHLLTFTCDQVADFYGIQPDNSRQSLYDWIVDHGYQEAIAFGTKSPLYGDDETYHNRYKQEKCQFRDDGSAVMTISCPINDNDIYEMRWQMIPWNMKDKGNSFKPKNHDYGEIRLALMDTQAFAVVMMPSALSGTESGDGNHSSAQQNDPAVNTAYTTMTFKEAVRDGDDIRITVQLQPKNEKCIATSMVDNLTDSCGPVAKYYGIETERSNKTLYGWMVDHGYQENLAIMIDSLEAEENGNYRGTFRTEKCQIMDDGSSLLTIAGPAADDNIYNLMWLFVPRNMKDKDHLLLWKMRDSGTLRLEITDTKAFSATIDRTSGLSVVESDLSTLVFNQAISDGYGIYVSAEVIPKHEQCLALSDLYSPHPSGFKNLDALTGIDGDYKGESLYKWVIDHNYEELLTLDIATPALIPYLVNPDDPTEGYDSFYDSGLRKAEFYDPSDYDFIPSDGFRPIYSGYSLLDESGTAIIDFVASADPDTKEIDLEWRQDLMKTEDARRSIFSLDSMDMLDTRYGSLTISVTEIKGDSEVIAEYKQIGKEMISTSVDITNVKVFRTSLGEYFEITTNRDRFANDLMHCSILPDPDMKNPSFDTALAPVCFCLQQNDNSAIFMVPAKYAGELPDTIMLDLWWETEAGSGWNGICYIQKVQ